MPFVRRRLRLQLGIRDRLTSATHLQKAIELIVEAFAAGAPLVNICGEFGISLHTLKRCRKAFGADGEGKDRRKRSSPLWASG